MSSTSGATRRKHSVRRSFSASMDRPWCRPPSASRRTPKFRQSRRCHLNTASAWRRVSPNSNRRSATAVSGNASSAACSMSECRGEWSTNAVWRHCGGLVRRRRLASHACAVQEDRARAILHAAARAGGEPCRHPQIASAGRRRAACRPGCNPRACFPRVRKYPARPAKRLDRVTELFGLAGKSRAKAS